MTRGTVPMGGESRAMAMAVRSLEDRGRRSPGASEGVFTPGQRFLDAIIVRLRGRGGVSEVWEALRMGKPCAMKVLRKRFELNPSQLARAAKEAQILVQLRHPNVIDVQEAGVYEDIFWMR